MQAGSKSPYRVVTQIDDGRAADVIEWNGIPSASDHFSVAFSQSGTVGCLVERHRAFRSYSAYAYALHRVEVAGDDRAMSLALRVVGTTVVVEGAAWGEVKLFDQEGRLVDRQPATFVVRLNAAAPGIYFVKADDGSIHKVEVR